MVRKGKGNYQGPKEERIPREKEEKEPEIITALKNEAFLKFLKNSRYSYLSDSKDLDLNKWDENLHSNIVNLYKAWDLARYKPKKDESKDKSKKEEPSLSRKIQEFYNKTISEEVGIQLSTEDLKSIEKRLLQEVIDVCNSAPENAEDFAAAMGFVATDLANFEKLDRLPAEIRKKRAEIIGQTVADKKIKKEKTQNISAEKQELLHQLEIRKKNLKTRIEKYGWTNAKNFPLIGRIFWDNQDKYILKKSVDEWQEEVEDYLNRIRKARETQNEFIEETPENIDQSITEMKKELAELEGQVEIKKSQITSAKWKSAIKVLFFGILGLSSRHKKIKEKEKSLEELEDGVKKYNEMIAQAEKKRAELPPEGVKSDKEEEYENLKTEYENLRLKYLEGFFLYDEINNKIKGRVDTDKKPSTRDLSPEAAAIIERVKTQNRDFLKGLAPIVSFDQLIKYIQKSPLPTFIFDLAVYSKKYLIEIITEAKKTKKLDKFNKAPGELVTKLKELISGKPMPRVEVNPEPPKPAEKETGKEIEVEVKFDESPTPETVKPEENTAPEESPEPEAPIQKELQDFLDKVASVVTLVELIKLIKDSPITVFNFKKKPFTKDDLAFSIITIKNEREKELQLAKVDKIPKELQAKVRELITGKVAPRVETKPEPAAPKQEQIPDDIEEIIPEKPQLELTEPQIKELQEITPEPAKPEEKPAPEKKKAKPAEPEITAPEEKKPEPPKYEILEDEDPAVALVDKIKAIRNSDNEISAKLLVLEAGELLKKYLAGLKGDRKINNNLYKELSKNLKKELGKIKSSNPQQMAVDVENIFNSIRSQAEAKPKEAKPTLKNEPETTIEEPVESETALSQEEQTQEIIEGISSSQEVEEIIEYLKTVPKVVDAEGREMSGQDMALKITRAVMNAGEINNMTEEELPTSYGLRDKIIELLGL